jgi:hypothetical protein
MQQRLSNLQLTHSIPHSSPDVRAQFRPLSQRGQQAQVQDTAGLELQAGTGPYCTPSRLLSYATCQWGSCEYMKFGK